MVTFPKKRLFSMVVVWMSIILLGGAIPPLRVLSAAEVARNQPQTIPTDPVNRIETQSAGTNAISLIQSNSPTCVLPVPHTGVCYIKWGEISVNTTDSAYISYLYIKINNKRVAHHRGFFQQSMYIPDGMYGKGFRVTCGLPGEGGDPDFGKIYNYEIRATDSSNATTANYGSVLCPADIVYIYLPAVRR